MTDPLNLETKIEAWLRERLSPQRLRHSLGVAEAAADLAEGHGIDPAPLRLAGLLHDCAREVGPHKTLELAREWGVSLRQVDEEFPVLLHGRLAEIIAVRDFDIVDTAVLTAVRYHTAGHPDMSLSDKIFFLSDHIDPGRDLPHVEGLRLLAFEDIDKAMLAAIDINLAYLQGAGRKVDPDTYLLLDFLMEKR